MRTSCYSVVRAVALAAASLSLVCTTSAQDRGKGGQNKPVVESDQPAAAQTPNEAAVRSGGEWCQTELAWEANAAPGEGGIAIGCPLQGACDNPATRDAAIPGAGTAIKNVRVRFVVFANNDGSNPAATQAAVDAQVATMNARYLPHKIQFIATTAFINSTQYRSMSEAEIPGMKNAFAASPGTQCNVYVTNIEAGYLGVGTFPWDGAALGNQGGIICDDGWFGNGQLTMVHEMGHNLGCWHTHHGVSEVVSCSDCYEKASYNAAQKDITGDLVSETPPTPTNFNCSAPGGSDCSGTPWGPTQPQNYMGYAPDSCYTTFTPQQAGRMHCWTAAILGGWLVPGPTCPGSGDCFASHPTPGCNIADCCNAVCAVDPFCCNNQWDGICASEAATICASCGGAGAGSCYVNDGTPYCNNADCCNAVCAVDPFCCNSSWDGICVNEANTICKTCGGAGAGSCYVADGTPFCNDAQCCNLVCTADPFCCATSWDSICVTEATNMCDCGGSATGSCFTADGTPYCDNPVCCDAVCAVDSFCCTTSWDTLCVNEANTICKTCGGAGSGSCFAADGTPSCDNAECCNAVCAVDSFCCTNTWDSICANEANTICKTCGGAGSGSCFAADGTPGCNNADCCNAVCAVDPFCCSTTWDGICANEAATICASCGGAGAGSCYTAGPAYCNNADCCNAVCAVDPFCCNNSWDGICVNEANTICKSCGGAGAGSCFIADGTPYCNKAACCNAVCAVDPFCCTTSWDGICVNEANALCTPCKADIAPPGGNNIVNIDDLLLVINSWGPCAGCAADIAPAGGNGVVNIDDLLFVINHWGPCP